MSANALASGMLELYVFGGYIWLCLQLIESWKFKENYGMLIWFMI